MKNSIFKLTVDTGRDGKVFRGVTKRIFFYASRITRMKFEREFIATKWKGKVPRTISSHLRKACTECGLDFSPFILLPTACTTRLLLLGKRTKNADWWNSTIIYRIKWYLWVSGGILLIKSSFESSEYIITGIKFWRFYRPGQFGDERLPRGIKCHR